MTVNRNKTRRSKEISRMRLVRLANDWMFIAEAAKRGDDQAIKILKQKFQIGDEIQLCGEELSEIPRVCPERRRILKDRIDLLEKLQKALLYEYRPDLKRARRYLANLYKRTNEERKEAL